MRGSAYVFTLSYVLIHDKNIIKIRFNSREGQMVRKQDLMGVLDLSRSTIEKVYFKNVKFLNDEKIDDLNMLPKLKSGKGALKYTVYLIQ